MNPSIRFEVFKRDAFTCVYCGRRSPDVILEVDHVLPVARGGTDDLDNLITSCVDCNRGKAARPLDHVAPGLNPLARAEQLAEQERQIAEYSRWRAIQRDREDQDLTKLAEVYRHIRWARFQNDEGESRWFWQEPAVRKFLRRLGYHEVLEALEVTATQTEDWTSSNDQGAALDAWRYFCGVCWRKIEGPRS